MTHTRFLLCGLLLFCITALNAQTEQGKFRIGGSTAFNFETISYNDSDHSQGIYISPQLGYFMFKNLELGLKTTLIHRFSKTTPSTRFTFSPILRYYFNKSRFKPFVQASHSLMGTYRYTIHLPEGVTRRKQTLKEFDIHGGISWYISEVLAMEFALGYTYEKNRTSDDKAGHRNKNIQLLIGFSIIL